MASSAVIAVGTVPTVVAGAPANAGGGIAGWFTLVTGGTTVSFGGPNVTTANGYPIISGGTFSGFIFPGDSLYAIGAAGGATVTILATGL